MANVELLRTLAMVMVVVMHFLSHSGRLIETGSPLSSVKAVGTLLEMFCLSAVNTYVFISGYFGIKSGFKPGKAVKLLCQIWFYAILIFLVLAAAGVPTLGYTRGSISVYGLIQYLFPIETEHYWFATSYFMLYLLTPVLNAAVKSMSKKQLQITLGGLLILFSGIKSLSPFGFAVDKYGYDLAWFICVYLVAAYFGMYGSAFFERRGWLVYVISSLAGFGIQMAMWFLCRRSSSFAYYFTVPFHYNFILCLTGAVGLFYGFLKIRIKEGAAAGVIRKLGAYSFGVYLLHEHIDLRTLWYGWLSGVINPEGNQGLLFFFLELFFCIVILFAAGIFIDWLRSMLFQAAGKFTGQTKMGRKLKELDGCFAAAANEKYKW